METALRLNPGDAEILTLYSTWASTFGHPERGAEMADHAIRLNPNYEAYLSWNAGTSRPHTSLPVDSKTRCASWSGSQKTIILQLLFLGLSRCRIGIAAYLANGVTLENAQKMAVHASASTTKLYDRTADEITLDEVERIKI
jgi:hypothetical protein